VLPPAWHCKGVTRSLLCTTYAPSRHALARCVLRTRASIRTAIEYM